MTVYVTSRDLPVVFTVTDGSVEAVTRVVVNAMTRGTIAGFSTPTKAVVVNFGQLNHVDIDEHGGGALGKDVWETALDRFLQ